MIQKRLKGKEVAEEKDIFVNVVELGKEAEQEKDGTKAVLVVDEIKKDQSRVESIIDKRGEIK